MHRILSHEKRLFACLLRYIYIYIYGGGYSLSATVSVIGKVNDGPPLNPRRDCLPLLRANTTVKARNPPFSLVKGK